MGAVHPGMARASFELEQLELDEGRLLVSGWWSGVRGMRFVRPALLVDGRKLLATLEHKPWAVGADGSWTAAFPWKERGRLDVSGVTLAVAPSVEVPLDAESVPPSPEPLLAAVPPPADRARGRATPAVSAAPVPPLADPAPPGRATPSLPAAPEAVEAAPPAPATPAGARAEHSDKLIETLREELRALERRLGLTREELHDTRALAAERAARCRELEQAAAARRRDVGDVETEKQELLHAQAMAVLDRDRAIAQREEAVADREAAVRTRARMEVQRDEALKAQISAAARRDEAIGERDEMRRQRDEVLLAHRALQDQRRGELAAAQRQARDDARAAPAPAPSPLQAPAPAAAADASAAPASTPATPADPPTQPFAAPAARLQTDARGAERPSGVRVIPAPRTVSAHLHRAHREQGSGVTQFDLWVVRILGTVAALAFIALLVMILKAFFVF